MKHYLLFLFILPLLLSALPYELSSKDSSRNSGMVDDVHVGAGLPDAVNTDAVYTDAVQIGNGLKNVVHAEVNSGCKNRNNKAKKACTKRKCLKHHKDDSSPAGGIPAPVCSIPLFAVLSQSENFRFSAPAALASHLAFHTVILLSPDLKQDPHPPRYS